ncbi:energy-dependent translational throttle protein EttA [bacterium]|nr:MAG: energy-dependent translational throttle protein EttA [bacterium]
MAQQYVYTLQNLRKVVPPDNIILDGISLSFLPGAKIGIIGHNGSGKSTLLKIMAGLDPEYQGTAQAAEGLRVGYLSQEPELDASLDVLGNVELGVQPIRDLLTRFEEISAKFAEPMTDDEMNALLEEQGNLQDQIDAVNAWELDRTLEIAMDSLRLPPGDAKVETLSGGEKRRVALCRLLLEKPGMLLLDEPTNHLDAESVAWLEGYLKDYAGTVIVVTHDRYFLDNVTGWILELDRGRYYPWEGNYSSWLDQKLARLDDEEKEESARQRTLKQELDWIRMSPKARQTKSKARIKRYNEMVDEDQRDGARKRIEIQIPPGPRLGDQVITAAKLSKGFGDKLLIDDLDFQLPPNAIVGVIGGNGAGKTTLFRMIVGEESADGGDLMVGDSVQLAHVDQTRENLDGTKTVFEEAVDGRDEITVGNRKIKGRAWVASFGFKGGDQQKPVGKLSGGERNRLQLAKLLRSGGNVLLLDEPTNDLDVDTLRALENALDNFAGCAVVISHDRWFLDRVATHILAFEGDSVVRFFEGNFQDYHQSMVEQFGEDYAAPHRMKFKKFHA